jgi:hypothetical protein
MKRAAVCKMGAASRPNGTTDVTALPILPALPSGGLPSPNNRDT